MKMIDMKMGKKERKEMMEPAIVGNVPEYPYQTKICIDGDKVESLGLDDMTVGDKVTMVCQCEVVEVSKRDGSMGLKKECYLQIQKIGNKDMDDEPTGFITSR